MRSSCCLSKAHWFTLNAIYEQLHVDRVHYLEGDLRKKCVPWMYKPRIPSYNGTRWV